MLVALFSQILLWEFLVVRLELDLIAGLIDYLSEEFPCMFLPHKIILNEFDQLLLLLLVNSRRMILIYHTSVLLHPMRFEFACLAQGVTPKHVFFGHLLDAGVS